MRPRSKRKAMSEINVVPYIDVMLVLLVIFMITAPLLSQGVKVDLPQVPSKPMPHSDREPVVISVDGAGNFFINYGEGQDHPKEAQALATLVAGLRKYQPTIPVYVKGDRSVDYGRVVELMALLQSVGVEGVGLITEPQER
jgi:biopolymer transport protein TolR